MRPFLWLAVALLLSASLDAREGLVNTYQLDSGTESYRLVLKGNLLFELTGPGGQQTSGNYVATDRKLGLVLGNLLRHFEYQVQNGNLLLRPTNTDGPEPNSLLGQMPPVQRSEQFTGYLTEANYRQKYAVPTTVQPPVVQHPPVTQLAAPATMEQILTQAQTDSQYHAYMAAGAKAFSEKRYPEARAHFIVANRLNPNAAEARDYASLCDGAAALVEGDTLRQRGDWREAREAYQRAKQVCPALGAVADSQMPGFRRHGETPATTIPKPTGAFDTGIAQQLRQGRTAEALRLSTEALQREPASLRLRTLKEGLEGLQMSDALHQSLAGILARARTHCDAIQKEEPLDGQTAQWNAALAMKVQQVTERSAAARNRYIENPYAGLGSTVADARTTADETGNLLERCRAFYAAKATEVAKEDQIDLPFMTIKTNKENKRVKRLNGYADTFKALSAEAAALAK